MKIFIRRDYIMKNEKILWGGVPDCSLVGDQQLGYAPPQTYKLKKFLCLLFLLIPLLFINARAYESTFSVTIPKDIVMDGSTKSATYSVDVKGNIKSGESAVVSVTPSNSFTLSNVVANGYPSKEAISAQVSQNATSWTYNDIMKGITTNGNIVANDISAGSWAGNFNFNVKFEVNSMAVNVTNGIATYSGSATNGGAKVEVTSPSNGATIKYGTTSGTYDLTSIPTYTNAGTYTIYYQVTATNYTTKTGSLTITINKANGSVTAPTAKSLTYSGSAQALVNAGSSSTGTIQYKLGDSGNYSTTIPTATNAGTYTVYYKVVGDSNHNDVSEASVSVTIATKAMTVSTTNGSATYSGSATNGGASVSVTTPSSGATIKYGTASGSYTLTSIPTYTNAGTYTIYYQVTATNYTTKTGSFTITISKASGSVTKPTAKSLTYSGSAQALVNAGSSSTGTIQYKLDSGNYSTTIPTATNAGTYKVYYKVVGDSNHNDVTEASVSVTIATKAMTVSATNGSATYSGSATNGGASVSVTTPSSGYTIKYGTASGTYNLTSIPTYTNAGTYTIYYQVTATNYTTKTGSFTITIATKAMTVSTTNGSATYSGSATNGGAKVSVTTPSSGYTIKYGTTNGTYDLTSIPTYTNAGTYTIYYQVTATNYTTKTGSFTITINKANGSVTAPTAKSLTYSGSAQALVNAGSSSTGTIQYKLGSSGSYSTSIPTAINAGTYTVYYKVVGDSNHNDVAEASVSVTIAKASGSVTKPTAKSLTYSGSAQALVNAGSSSTGTIQYKLDSGNYSTTIPTATNAGTYTVYYKVVGDSNHNDVTEASVSVTIAKASGSVTKPTAKSLTYSGSAQALVNVGSSSTGTIQYKLGSSGSYSTSIPTAINAGTYTVYYKVVGDSNHNDVTEASVSVTIATKAMTVSATNGSATYSGSATNGGASVSVTTPSSGYTIKYGTTSGSYTLTSIPTYTNAGTYTIYYQVTATNYTTKTGSFTITIATKTMTVSATNGSATYSGSATNGGASVSVTTPSSGATIKYGTTSGSYTLTSIPTYTNAGTYTIYYQVTATNYTTKTGSFTITINKANGSVTAPTAKSLTYSGSEQALVNAGSSSTGTIQYKLGDSGSYSTSIPTAINAGTYKVYYKVVGDSNHNDVTEASVSVTIAKPTISGSSWSAIQAACKAGLANEYFSVGDTRTISLGSMNTMTYAYYGTLGDTTTLAAQTATIVVGDISSDGKTLTMLFTSYSTQAPAYQMNPQTDDYTYGTNIGGWKDTILREWLNSTSEGGFYAALPSDLKSVIKENDTTYSATYNASEVLTCKDNLWLLSSKEVFGGGTATSAGSATSYENLAAFNAETQLAYFANGASSVRYSSGTDTCKWWLRSSIYSKSSSFTNVKSNGSSYYDQARYAYSVFPAFCIG
jgi:methionine-rich copper-binding protein CopC